jgi:hypothetical protein
VLKRTIYDYLQCSVTVYSGALQSIQNISGSDAHDDEVCMSILSEIYKKLLQVE